MTSSVFASAAAAFARLVRAIPETSWEGPGLGDWDMRALVGHTSRSLVTVSEYLRAPADHEDVDDAVAYYVWVRDFMGSAGAEAINERGRQAGRDLGADPVDAVDRLVARALADVENAGDPVISVIGGLGIRLSHYLQTRVFELTVHGVDIARAAGLDVEPPADAMEQSAVLATRVAARLGQGETVLSALTGRSALPPGYSVV
ncbi:maleylpyruvate isomerase N-terminal domain-containing protein [Mycolicibacterium frederiksbergense]|uniref:maleylpyruvate isomerase N-terminal domain-containing protein n=1 Tax=Mycolicibacterium frederiksbergense TaxID=117567 RepID=UPI00265C8851|nr:maleylpyruvate isomerase N-terminal domain-containing protein [Mycolicibacterium frederiksbergense]MDO0974914.1 maleylpyruvate isomerase N-terminal domain-containing protein [Mycolicibacterium frederiksbergense]